MDYPFEQQGFFVKSEKYSGPFKTLKEARADARLKGKNIPIYHGVLVYTSDTVIDDSKLFLVPKVKK